MVQKACIKCKGLFEATETWMTICKKCWAQLKNAEETKAAVPAAGQVDMIAVRIAALGFAIKTLIENHEPVGLFVIQELAEVYVHWILTGQKGILEEKVENKLAG